VWGYSEIYIYTADVNCYISILDCILCCNIRIDLVLNKVVVVACDFGSRVIDDSLSLCIYNDRNLSVHLSPLHTVKYGNVSSVCCMYLMIADFTNLRCLYWCTWYGQMHVLAFALLEWTHFFPFTG